jgi:hypothetical protein
MAFLPFIQNTFNYISRVQTKSNIKTVNLPAQKDSGLLHPINEDSPSAHSMNVSAISNIQLLTLLGADNIQLPLHTAT